MIMFFKDAARLCSEYGKFELGAQIIQIAKGHAKSIEAARKACFPFVRALDDYFHFKQVVVPQLEVKLKVSAEGADVQADPSDRSREAARGGGRGRGRGRGGQRGQRRNNTPGKRHKRFLLDCVEWTRSVPTLGLFDILWRAIFQMMKIERGGSSRVFIPNIFPRGAVGQRPEVIQGRHAGGIQVQWYPLGWSLDRCLWHLPRHR